MTNLNEVKYKYGFWAFIPLLVFLLLFLGSGIIYTLKGTDSAFNQVPILAALLIGMIVAFAMNPKAKMDDKIQAFSNGISESGVILMVLIFMSAGAFSSVSKAMGGVDSVVNLGIHFIPSQFLVPGIFIIGCFISISTGTSVGTVVTMQAFVKRPHECEKGIGFDRKLYIVRRVFEHSNEDTYIVSLSSRTIVYKGMFLVDQLGKFFSDLRDPNYKSALAIVHSRFSTNTNPSWERAHPYRYLVHNGEINTIHGNVDKMQAREETMESGMSTEEARMQAFLEVRNEIEQ